MQSAHARSQSEFALYIGRLKCGIQPANIKLKTAAKRSGGLPFFSLSSVTEPVFTAKSKTGS